VAATDPTIETTGSNDISWIFLSQTFKGVLNHARVGNSKGFSFEDIKTVFSRHITNVGCDEHSYMPSVWFTV